MASKADAWPGLATEASPHSGYARVSDNARPLRPGILSGRGGVRECWCESMTARGAAVSDVTTLPNVLALATLRRAEGDYVIFLDSDGALMAGRRPT